MKRSFLSLLSVLLALSSYASAQEPIRLGVCLPLTGNLGYSGQAVWQGIKIAHKMCPHVQGRPVVLKIADTRSETTEATCAIFRLTEKGKVVALIGDRNSRRTSAGSCQTSKPEILMVSPAVTCLPGVRGNDISSTSEVESDQAILAARLALHNSGAGTAAIIYDIAQEDSIGRAARFRNEFIQGGGRILFESRIKTGDRDFTGQIIQIRKTKPQVIYAPVHHIECALMARQARDMGLDTPLMAGNGVQVPKPSGLDGKSVEGLYTTRGSCKSPFFRVCA
jgi:branched-chain amino acid transport system substrate-binding protein